MTFASASEFHVYLQWVNAHLAYSVLNVKALVDTFNQDFTVIVKTDHLQLYTGRNKIQ